MLATNQKDIVQCAKICYEEYPTIVNALSESGITYNNTKGAYASMDNKFSGSRMGIGWSSNLAQLAMTYYWTEMAKENPDMDKAKEFYDNFVILSVLAQIIIDSCKREYEIDGDKETKRISKLPCMTLTKSITINSNKQKEIKCDFPLFMRYTKEIKHTKNGKELADDIVQKNKQKLLNRINYDLQCPMNWLEEWLDKVQNIPNTNTKPMSEYFVKMSGEGNRRQISKIRALVENYDKEIKKYKIENEEDDELLLKINQSMADILEQLSKMQVNNIVTINRLIETSFGLETNNNRSLFYKNGQKYTRKMLNLLYKMDKNKFLSNFVCAN